MGNDRDVSFRQMTESLTGKIRAYAAGMDMPSGSEASDLLLMLFSDQLHVCISPCASDGRSWHLDGFRVEHSLSGDAPYVRFLMDWDCGDISVSITDSDDIDDIIRRLRLSAAKLSFVDGLRRAGLSLMLDDYGFHGGSDEAGIGIFRRARYAVNGKDLITDGYGLDGINDMLGGAMEEAADGKRSSR